MLEKLKGKRWTKICLWALLVALVLFVVITASVIKFQKDKLDRLNAENAEMERVLEDET